MESRAKETHQVYGTLRLTVAPSRSITKYRDTYAMFTRYIEEMETDWLVDHDTFVK